ncbi:hypothetical protein [Calidifontibacillus erzurumensis]|uniref:Coat F domain-containing protein n=1 Tax=Calidifontibacillus erzurumensis TaxID=2741433 RepID=A0A8J8GJJ9_9BACI|nr:hypothetical protein [Calidifontibacillus erzurumensis]NSL52936.1 hypothetical protein [Calidifontibacillus erzurumensis]
MQQTQMNQNQQTQSFMPQPPSIISTKDELYIKDMLSWNLLAMKKAHFFAQQCQDPEVKAAIEKAGQMHQRHYQQILNHLGNHIQNANQTRQTMQ